MSRIAPRNARSTPTQPPPMPCTPSTTACRGTRFPAQLPTTRGRARQPGRPGITPTRPGEAGHGRRRERQRAAHGPRTGMVPCIIPMHRTWCGCRSEVWFVHAAQSMPGGLLPANIWRRLGSHRSDERRPNGAASAAQSMFHRIKVNCERGELPVFSQPGHDSTLDVVSG